MLKVPSKVLHIFHVLADLATLPVASLHFNLGLNPDNVKSTYQYFTKPHPRYKLFRNKALGAALVHIEEFGAHEKYLESIKGRNRGAHFARKAKSRGYVIAEIDRNQFVDEIHDINTSLENRQGHVMDPSYLKKISYYPSLSNFKYYGVMNPNGKLMAYCTLGFYGDFAAFERMLGYRNNDGIMHFMLVDVICRLIDTGEVKYLMYDTFFGATEGLKLFKTMLGFKPYRVIYSITNGRVDHCPDDRPQGSNTGRAI